ncbi:MAG TPA: 50S ribosomal protein L10 [Bacteroidales bacterium]|nr:50S ribosomal protein L10 [Bacteroidales bacterium]HPS17250.1 50S ribosomal protein L10 [Bacteroidales bacterium]
MRKEDKNQIIDSLVEQLNKHSNFYLADISELNVDTTNKLRRLCFRRNVELQVVKNTLLKKAMEKTNRDFGSLYDVLKGTTSIMFSDTGNVPARLIKEFRKNFPKPVLKGAYVEETCFVGADQLEVLVNIKSKNELIGDIVALLQTPVRNVIGALQSGGQNIAGIVKTLSEKSN